MLEIRHLNNSPHWVVVDGKWIRIRDLPPLTKEKPKVKDLTVDQAFKQAAEKLKVSEQELRAKYGHLTAGLIKMNLSNRVRNLTKQTQGK